MSQTAPPGMPVGASGPFGMVGRALSSALGAGLKVPSMVVQA